MLKLKNFIKENFTFILGIIIFSLLAFTLHHQIKHYSYHKVLEDLKYISHFKIFLSICFVFVSYLILTFFDALALRYLGKPIPFYKIFYASFTGYSFSHNVGFSYISGASVRYRFYSAWGLNAYEIGLVTLFISATIWLGYLVLSGFLFLFYPVSLPDKISYAQMFIKPLGILFLLMYGVYFYYSFKNKQITFKKFEFRVPPLRYLGVQTLLSVIDWCCAALALYVLLPSAFGISFSVCLGAYLIALCIGQVIHIPGGLGVFEGVVLLFISQSLGPDMDHESILAPLVIYRLTYYVLPLLVSLLILAFFELRTIGDKIKKLQKPYQIYLKWSRPAIPILLATAVFGAGIYLIFSASIPPLGERLEWLKNYIPLEVMEASHFLAFVVGMLLLLLARGIQKRLDAAYYSTILLLVVAVFIAGLREFDYLQAFLFTLLIVLFLPCRKHFYRKSALLHEPLSRTWVLSIFGVLLTSFGLGFFTHKHQAYSSELWWKFALHADASRFLRGCLGMLMVILFYAIKKLLNPSRHPQVLEKLNDGIEAEEIEKLVRNSPHTNAFLALTGDKRFFMDENRKAFLMYQIEGKSWIVMGDPVGEREAQKELIWNFYETCDRYKVSPVFYQVSQKNLPFYLDIGLSLLKLGEEAKVNLQEFTLEGGAMKSLRQSNNRLSKEFTFEIIAAEQVKEKLEELKNISNQWLEAKNTREKSFSLGAFEESYMQKNPVELLKREGKIIAFANLWLSETKEEMSLDLMRYLPENTNGVMDFLFVNLMLWGKAQGYHHFNLGMAPLSGIEERQKSPMWNKLGNFIYRHGENFYNFEGLRDYKEKFQPHWEPKYLACPGGLKTPLILTNVASLISGGVKGILGK